jgi:hypothetical protein
MNAFSIRHSIPTDNAAQEAASAVLIQLPNASVLVTHKTAGLPLRTPAVVFRSSPMVCCLVACRAGRWKSPNLQDEYREWQMDWFLSCD